MQTQINEKLNQTDKGEDALVVVHGGAGNIRLEYLGKEKLERVESDLTRSLTNAFNLLKKGPSAVEAVAAAVTVLEDAEMFNAGRGSCLNELGKVEMDASIMNGANLEAGAVACISNVKNPVLLAKAVMEHSNAVLLVGEGAELFAENMTKLIGLELAANEYFKTPDALSELKRFQEKGSLPQNALSTGSSQGEKYGTVGACARDLSGNVAAATSTGGLIGKLKGRVGDSPLVGAGVYADNQTCAISTTGFGESFIRVALAHEVSSLVRYAGKSIAEAAVEAIFYVLDRSNGKGGLISINAQGDYALPFNTQGMYRGVITSSGQVKISIS